MWLRLTRLARGDDDASRQLELRLMRTAVGGSSGSVTVRGPAFFILLNFCYSPILLNKLV
jgi:hypothetical protein